MWGCSMSRWIARNMSILKIFPSPGSPIGSWTNLPSAVFLPTEILAAGRATCSRGAVSNTQTSLFFGKEVLGGEQWWLKKKGTVGGGKKWHFGARRANPENP